MLKSKNGVVALSGQLTQNKIYSGSDGIFSLALTMTADETADPALKKAGHVDMVIVLDRSGSMEGQKLAQAKRAVLDLLSKLGGPGPLLPNHLFGPGDQAFGPAPGHPGQL